MTRRSSLPLDLLSLDRVATAPMHRQLYDSLRTQILEGRLRAGTRLPATRLLARDLGVGRNTVIAAYDALLAEGYLESRSGSGTYVARLPQPNLGARRIVEQLALPPLSRRGQVMTGQPRHPTIPGRVAFHPGYPDTGLFPFSTWARLLARHARRPREDLFGYHFTAGHPALREAIAEYLAISRGVECSPEQVVVLTGAQAALDVCARLLIDEGETAWIEEPGYMGAYSALLSAGALVRPLPVDRHGWQLGTEVQPPPRLIYVTPSCQWPLGTVMRMEERLRLLALAERHDAWIIEDDYDSEYRFRGRPTPAMQGLDPSGRVIYIGTFAKTLFPALRLGFLVVPLDHVDGFKRAVNATGHFAPLLLQAALADFMRDGYFSSHLKRMRRLYGERQRRFLALCRQHLARWLTADEPEAGMQVVARLAPGPQDTDVAQAALARGLDLLPLSIHYRHGPAEQGLVLGYAGVGERETLAGIRTLRLVLEALETGKRSPEDASERPFSRDRFSPTLSASQQT
jgi:GntR family transcriptional regulator/MocR family aminotransferase